MIKWLKRKWKQFWCIAHTWREYNYMSLTDSQWGIWEFIWYRYGNPKAYKCIRCGKILITHEIPISYEAKT